MTQKREIYVDATHYSAIVVCTICNQTWGVLDRAEGTRVSRAHRNQHKVERLEATGQECSYEGCNKVATYRGLVLCHTHYSKQRYWKKKGLT